MDHSFLLENSDNLQFFEYQCFFSEFPWKEEDTTKQCLHKEKKLIDTKRWLKMAGGVGILSREMSTSDNAHEETEITKSDNQEKTQIVGDNQVTSNSQDPA